MCDHEALPHPYSSKSTTGKSKVACFATTSATILQTVAFALPDWLIYVNLEGIHHYRVGLWQFCRGTVCEEYSPKFWPGETLPKNVSPKQWRVYEWMQLGFVWFLVVEGLETIGLVALLIAALLLAAYALLPPRTPSRVRCTGVAGVVLTFLAAGTIACGIILMVVKMFQEGFNEVLGPGTLTLDWSTKLAMGSAVLSCAGAITLAVDLQIQAELQALRSL